MTKNFRLIYRYTVTSYNNLIYLARIRESLGEEIIILSIKR